METTIKQDLQRRFEALKSENPKTRIRDAATQLGVSEAELVYLQDGNSLLAPHCQEILNDIKTLGPVMALTRNDHAVHERKGTYTKASFNGHVGLVVNPDIDLRLFMTHWAHVFAVNENNRQSIQFFDTWGNAVHKIYMTSASDEDAFQALIQKYSKDAPSTFQVEREKPAPKAEKPDTEIDVEAFRKEWTELQDTHDFFGILRRHGVSRRQAMRLAPQDYTQELDVSFAEKLLQLVSEKGIDFMVFVGNDSCIQIHTGKAEKIVRTGPWINILDEAFNLHLRDGAIDSLWLVKKPTDLGLVHSLEAYDAAGNLIVQFFGKRKPNIPEREDWREIITLLNAE